MDGRIKRFARHLGWLSRRFRAPRAEPREEGGLQFAASGRLLSPVPVRDEASGIPDVPAAPPPLARRSAWPIRRTSIQCPGLHEPAFAAALPLNFDSPTDSRDHFARSSAFQRSAPSMRPSALGPSPPSSSPCGSDWAYVSPRPLGAVPGPEGPLSRREKQAGSPWLRDHFDTAFEADNRGGGKGCVRTGARPVHNLGKSPLFSPETEGIQRVPSYPQVPGAMLNAPDQRVRDSRISSSASHSSSAAESSARALSRSAISRSKPALSRA